LEEIPPHLVAGGSQWRDKSEAVPTPLYSWDKKSPYKEAPPSVKMTVSGLKAGDRVRHTQFGDGIVISCRPVKGDEEAAVAFQGAGVKKLLLSFAPLEKMN